METRKKVQYFKVKWVNIATAGNTWEPVAHFIGDPAKQALSAFRQKRAADEAAADAARAQRRSGNTPGNTPGNDNVNGDNAATGTDRDIEMATDDTNGANARHLQFRKKHSDVWNFFAPKRFEVQSNAYLAKCKMCGVDIKALNTTNLKAHLNSMHANEMCKFKTDCKKESVPLVLSCVIYLVMSVIFVMPMSPTVYCSGCFTDCGRGNEQVSRGPKEEDRSPVCRLVLQVFKAFEHG
jgi:hypothetical protein